MIGKKLISIKPIALSEVKDIIKERSEVGELTYEQNLSNEYSKKFSKLPKAKAEKLLQEIKEALEMPEDFAVKIVDVLPDEIEKLRLLAPKGFKLPEDKMQKIIELVKKAK